MLYAFVIGAGVFGRLLGGLFHYVYKFPLHLKFLIAVIVYIAISFFEATYLFVPVVFMIIISLLNGAISVTSYNIRISATQSYIPDTLRARFNGSFQKLTTFGSISGQLLAGAVAYIWAFRSIIVVFSFINLLGVFLVVLRKRKSIAFIYNRDV